MQAAPLHVYRGSPRDRARQHVSMPPTLSYSTFHDLLSESEGEEEYGTPLGSGGRLEGAQINTDLYDAYLPSTYPPISSGLRSTERAADSSHHPDPISTGSWLLNSPPPTSSVWTGLGGPGSSSLFRQNTLRRSHRSRPAESNDFASFTTRRRSIIRGHTTSATDDDRRADSSEPVARPSSTENTRPVDSADGSVARPLDFSAWLARHRARASSSAAASASVLPDNTGGLSAAQRPTSSQMWYSMTSTSPEPMSIAALSRRSSTSDVNEDRRQSIAPRLRRGGLRPPESLLLQGPGSPAIEGHMFHSAITDAISPRDDNSADVVLPAHHSAEEEPQAEAQHASVSRSSPAIEAR